MNGQNYKNHRQLIPGFHGFTYLAAIALLVGSIMNLIRTSQDNYYSASLLVLVAVILALLIYYSRKFALIAQDRAIRAEEQLRHFILTGKRLDPRLTTRQIIALRFAGDEEFPSLAQKAADENLGNDAIKKQIRSWKADWHRV